MMKFDWSLVTRRVLLGPLAALVLLTALGGCGFKTLPVAPQAVVPRPITDLRYELSEKGVTLFWTYPAETLSGEDISSIDEFILYRAVVPADSYCETCPIPFGKPIVLPGGALPGEGRKIGTYEATLLRPGSMYFFKIRSKTGWLAESADSNLVSFIWQIPTAAPTGVEAATQGNGIVLSWQPVTTHIDGTPVTEPVRYQVSRSQGGAPFANLGEPVDSTTFTDTTIQSGRRYSYRVQAMGVYDQGLVGGGVSEPVTATPQDRTPPAPPTGVNAIRTGAGVKVYWQPVREDDLKGYRVYRRVSGEGPVLLGEVDTEFTTFDDNKVPGGAERMFYSVSSFDRSKPANESARSPEVMVIK